MFLSSYHLSVLTSPSLQTTVSAAARAREVWWRKLKDLRALLAHQNHFPPSKFKRARKLRRVSPWRRSQQESGVDGASTNTEDQLLPRDLGSQGLVADLDRSGQYPLEITGCDHKCSVSSKCSSLLFDLHNRKVCAEGPGKKLHR